MTNLTIRIPAGVARDLEEIAAAQKKTVEEVALDRLGSYLDARSSPKAVLQAIRKFPRASPAAVDDLNAAIASARLPVSDRGAFDPRRP